LFAQVLASFLAFFNRCAMHLLSGLGVSCPEHEMLESEFREARDRLRALTRLRQLTRLEEKQLADRVAMAIARMKEHDTEHSCQR
jgi:uncharacterized protein YgfB (UPF0149 family)